MLNVDEKSVKFVTVSCRTTLLNNYISSSVNTLLVRSSVQILNLANHFLPPYHFFHALSDPLK